MEGVVFTTLNLPPVGLRVLFPSNGQTSTLWATLEAKC